MSAISKDVLTNRRSYDICDRGECLYPTVIQLAEEVEKLEEGIRKFLEPWKDEQHYPQLRRLLKL